MSLFHPLCCALAGLMLLAPSAWGQDEDRIWGRVTTVSGEQHEGFIRWDRNEGSWVDILDGSKRIPDENYVAWLEASHGGERPVRTIELLGHRISWNEEDRDFPSLSRSGIRFGHIESLTVTAPDRVELLLRSGERLELTGGSSDIGRGIRDLLVEDPDRGSKELDWDDLESVHFSAVPAGARASASRLYGTVEDRYGRRFTGYVSWDLDEILGSDVLDGDDDDGEERSIPFRELRRIERRPGGSTVTLTSGEELELWGTNDVGRGNRGVQISEPALGMVEVEWGEFRSLTLEDPPEAVGYEAFDGGGPLYGTIVTQSGEEITGKVRWDADEERSWELVDGKSEDVVFTIELGRILRIERDEAFGAHVTLLDGRTFALDDSDDLDWDNRGIFVLPGAPDEDRNAPAAEWTYVSWDEFREARFVHPAKETLGS